MWRLLSDHLPPLPPWWKQLSGIVHADTIDSARAVELIRCEPRFCAEFVRICRFAGLSCADDRLDNYLAWLGKEGTHAVMIGAFLISHLAAQGAPLLKEYARRIEYLATTTRRLARLSVEINALEAYVAGLVHHAGALPLLGATDLGGALSSVRLDFSLESLTAQWLYVGTDTIELGQAMALLWDYPTVLRESLRTCPDAAEDLPRGSLAYVVRAADLLCRAGLQIPEAFVGAPSVHIGGSELVSKRSNILRFMPFPDGAIIR
jgi:hypothetical protein